MPKKEKEVQQSWKRSLATPMDAHKEQIIRYRASSEFWASLFFEGHQGVIRKYLVSLEGLARQFKFMLDNHKLKQLNKKFDKVELYPIYVEAGQTLSHDQVKEISELHDHILLRMQECNLVYPASQISSKIKSLKGGYDL